MGFSYLEDFLTLETWEEKEESPPSDIELIIMDIINMIYIRLCKRNTEKRDEMIDGLLRLKKGP